jgi:hypothetical protein
VADSILKTKLIWRTPVHNITAITTSTREDMRKPLIYLIKRRGLDYGITRQITGALAIETARIYPNSNEQAQRNAKVTEVSHTSVISIGRLAYVAVLVLWLFPLLCSATTYYVDAIYGNDLNDGISAQHGWQTLARVNEVKLQPGDRVLFHGGQTWIGQLELRGGGEENRPIRVGLYGSPTLPHIDGAGGVEDVVRLYNIQQIEVRDLEITNHGTSDAVRRGVHVILDNYGVARHIVIAGLYIHDVNGTNTRKDNGGIIFRTIGAKVPSRFDDLQIERNVLWKVDRSAIAAISYSAQRSLWFPSLHVVIRQNYVEDIGGDGIVPWATDGVVVEDNIVRRCNARSSDYNAGIWPWSADNSIFRRNDVSSTQGVKDGEGYDSDYNSRNTLFELNYSHDNTGGFMLICTPGNQDPVVNIGNTGTLVQYNISHGDKTRIFNISGGKHMRIENNAIFVAAGVHVQAVLISKWDGWADDVVFRGNRFAVEGFAEYGHEVSRSRDGSYEMAPGWGGATGVRFEGNTYIGQRDHLPEDSHAKLVVNSLTNISDWNGPKFDPSHPEQFGNYLKEHSAWMQRLFEEVKPGHD